MCHYTLKIASQVTCKILATYLVNSKLSCVLHTYYLHADITAQFMLMYVMEHALFLVCSLACNTLLKICVVHLQIAQTSVHQAKHDQPLP